MNQSQDLYPSTQSAAAESHRQQGGRNGLSRHWRWWVVLSSALALLATAGVLIHIEPPFYSARLAVNDEVEQAKLSKQFLTKATRLLSDLQNAKTWSGGFDEEEINAWLADDFENNHAKQVLPEAVSQPRIELDGDVARVGFRYRKGPVSAVIHVGIRAWVPRRDVLAVEFDRAWCGYFPLPTTYTQQLIESFAHSHSMDVTWKRHRRSLVALMEFPREQRELVLQKVEIKDDWLRIKGASGRFTYPTSDYAPSAN